VKYLYEILSGNFLPPTKLNVASWRSLRGIWTRKVQVFFGNWFLEDFLLAKA